MRSWASALVAMVACRAPATPAIVATRTPPPCKAIASHCEHARDEAAVFALVRHRCWACHAADGIAGHDFPDLSALRRAPVAEMVGTCQMPPDGSPLPEPERQLLVEWATCAP